MSFTMYDIENAPSPANSELERSQKAFGFIPNLHRVLAASPETLEAYKYLHGQFQKSSFNSTELTVVWQTINFYNQCHYCLPAHTGIAHMMNVEPSIIETLRNGQDIQDSKLSALQTTTRAIVDQRGHLTEEQMNSFREAGYSEQQLLEILLGLAQKTISNYANHMANTPLDEAFQQYDK